MLINSGVKRIVYLEGYGDPLSLEMLAEAGVSLEKFEKRGGEDG